MRRHHERGHGLHGHLHAHLHAFAHGHFHRKPDSCGRRGHPHGMLHAGWHFLERLYHRMPWHAMGHRGHREGHGRGGWGGWGGGMGDGDGDGFMRGRKFSSMDLQLLLLATLADKPAHGYELIRAIEALSNGFYTPSPGMVYPALTYLEELGHLLVTQEGNRKSYSLSDAGREHLELNRERVEAMLARLAHIGAKMESMRRAYSGEAGADWGEEGGWAPELLEARRKLKSALYERADMPPEEQRRIADILLQAAKAITGA